MKVLELQLFLLLNNAKTGGVAFLQTCPAKYAWKSCLRISSWSAHRKKWALVQFLTFCEENKASGLGVFSETGFLSLTKHPLSPGTAQGHAASVCSSAPGTPRGIWALTVTIGVHCPGP